MKKSRGCPYCGAQLRQVTTEIRKAYYIENEAELAAWQQEFKVLNCYIPITKKFPMLCTLPDTESRDWNVICIECEEEFTADWVKEIYDDRFN